MTEDYTPYGPEWEAAMMKTNKKTMMIVMRMALTDRDNEIKLLKNIVSDLEDTLGLRNRSNPDLTIEE